MHGKYKDDNKFHNLYHIIDFFNAYAFFLYFSSLFSLFSLRISI